MVNKGIKKNSMRLLPTSKYVEGFFSDLIFVKIIFPTDLSVKSLKMGPLTPETLRRVENRITRTNFRI